MATTGLSSLRPLCRGCYGGVLTADVRVHQGRLEEADQLLKGLEEHPDAAHPLAALHLIRGRTALARERIERALATAVAIPTMRLLGLLAEAWLADDDVAGAERAGRARGPMAARMSTD